MKTNSGIGLVMAAAGAIANLPAAASPVTLSQSVGLNALLQQGGSSTLSFDIGSFLSGQGYSASEVIGGTLSVFGFSEASYGSPQAAPYGDYNVQTSANGSHTAWYAYYVPGYSSCRWWGGCYYSPGYTYYSAYQVQDYQRTADRDLLVTDAVADRMQVTVGSSSASDTADTHSASTGNFGAYIYDGTINAGCQSCSQTTLYHRERNVYSAVYGALEVSLALDAAALLDLRDDGQLQVGLAAPVGQFNVNRISFDLLAQRLAKPQAAALTSGVASTVPEPTGLALSALALAAALATGRRRKQPAA